MKKRKPVSKNRYILRQVPARVDKCLRQRARTEGKSLNQVALEALERGVGLSAGPVIDHSWDDLAGTWVHDPECEALLDEMRQQNDWEFWR